uniref:Myotubularin phosphatase domain-containing protein n=1 Tax=Heterorhabditis bacteriophora TaxID=37862 RepID=A0A1I7WA48_HETBA
MRADQRAHYVLVTHCDSSISLFWNTLTAAFGIGFECGRFRSTQILHAYFIDSEPFRKSCDHFYVVINFPPNVFFINCKSNRKIHLPFVRNRHYLSRALPNINDGPPEIRRAVNWRGDVRFSRRNHTSQNHFCSVYFDASATRSSERFTSES